MTDALRYDVAIIGGGPGGLYTGRALARLGCRAAVFEEHQTIGEPVHCTGILAEEAFDEFDLPRRAVLNALQTARFHSPSGQVVEYTSPHPEAVVIDRRVFDQCLALDAEAAGVVLHRGWRVTSVTRDASGVTIDSASGTARAAAIVLACGASYGFQRRLGLGLPRTFLQSAQMELPSKRLGDVELHFGADIAPKGFAWAVPVRRAGDMHVRIGVMCDHDAAGFFERMVRRVEGRWGVPANIGAPRQKILPLAPIDRTYADRVLVVGDAAGLVKPTTGGGIYYSLVSAALAADVLARAVRSNDLRAATLSEYERGWRKKLESELQAQLSLRMLAERLTDEQIESLFELAQTDGIMPIVKRTAEFNRHRNLIVALLKHPPARKVLFRRLTGSAVNSLSQPPEFLLPSGG